MRFLADENIPLPTVRHLRVSGHDVVAIAEDSPGVSDASVIERATREDRIIPTFDRDDDQLIFVLGVGSPPGLVYLRLIPVSPTEPSEVNLGLLASSSLSLRGQFSTVSRDHVRQRPMP